MNKASVAYFSMEIGIKPEIATYSGGLGILAGDTIRSAADMKIPMVAVSLVHRKGYFRQKLDEQGWQSEFPVDWKVEDLLKEMNPRVEVAIEGRKVHLRAWKYEMVGVTGFKVPIYFLDTDIPENTDADRTFTHYLYGGDARYRLCQETILGIGGVRMLRALGYDALKKFHLNEGHASLLTLELLDENARANHKTVLDVTNVEAVKKQCVFTTHTPVPAGHDQFPMDLVRQVIGHHQAFDLKECFCANGHLNLTYVALNLSHYVNGVAKKHGEVSRKMFSGYVIDAITNGIHVATWASEPFQQLFDTYVPGWRADNSSLRYALGIPKRDIWEAHVKVKQSLFNYIKERTGTVFQEDVFTLGFARRATAYKRADLLFRDPERLKAIAQKAGRLQIVFAGKAHPHDHHGKEIIHRIFQARDELKEHISICYLENYDMELGKLITSGVDVWLNTPEPPLEASGTSGMKGAVNGVPSLSVLDGWWIEGCIEGGTGWAIGELDSPPSQDRAHDDMQSLYGKLETIVIPTFYQRRDKFINIMRNAIALNGSFFNTQRMMQEYVVRAYFL